MHELSETSVHQQDRRHQRGSAIDIDWAASCRLALVVSVFAAIAVLALSSLVSETVLIVAVIAVGTATSWVHLDHGRLSRAVPVRHR
jgi:hypothetical protein